MKLLVFRKVCNKKGQKFFSFKKDDYLLKIFSGFEWIKDFIYK